MPAHKKKAAKKRSPKQPVVKRKIFKGSAASVLVTENAVISLVLGMAPQKSLDMIQKIIERLDEKLRKRLIKRFCGTYGLTPEVKAKLKKLDRLERLAKKS